MLLAEAKDLAEALLAEIRPFCTRAEIAGSVRREKPECRDLEIVCVPRWAEEPDPTDLFGERTRAWNALYREWAQQAAVQWIKPGTAEIVPWHVLPTGKYWRGLLPCGMKLDLFLTQLGNYGLQYVIRTGSWEFSKALVTHALKIGKPSAEGWLRDGEGGDHIETPNELDVFSELGLAWVWPRDRTDGSAVRAVRREAVPA